MHLNEFWVLFIHKIYIKSINATVNIYSFCVNKSQNEDINSCVYALIQLSGHSPKTVNIY